jgi:hypothetical protein
VEGQVGVHREWVAVEKDSSGWKQEADPCSLASVGSTGAVDKFDNFLVVEDSTAAVVDNSHTAADCEVAHMGFGDAAVLAFLLDMTLVIR